MVPWRARRLAQRLERSSDSAWRGVPLWFRRSVFTRRGVPLLVTEWFSPAVRQRAPGPSR
jgi:chorismate-pyruvate lyase